MRRVTDRGRRPVAVRCLTRFGGGRVAVVRAIRPMFPLGGPMTLEADLPCGS